MPRVLLYAPTDDGMLSERLCILRAQLEVFAATPDDVRARGSRGFQNASGRRPIAEGRVGIRCVHCADLPQGAAQRAKGAVSYPNSIRLMHQSVRNWRRYHFHACAYIPSSIKEKFDHGVRDRREVSKKDSGEYWVRSCQRMGLVDVVGEDGEEDGIRFRSSIPGGSSGDGDDGGVGGGGGDGRVGIDSEVAEGVHVTAALPINCTTESMSGKSGNESSETISASKDSLGRAPMKEPGHSVKKKGVDHDGAVPYNEGSSGMGSNFNAGGLSLEPPSVAATLDLPPSELAPTGTDGVQLPSKLLAEGNHQGASQTTAARAGVVEGAQIQAVDTRTQQVGRDDVSKSVHLALELARDLQRGHGGSQDALVSRDLATFGRFLYKHFTGTDLPPPYESGIRINGDLEEEVATVSAGAGGVSDESRMSKKGRHPSTHCCYVPMRDMAFPVSLCILVSSLIDAAEESDRVPDRYESFDQVVEDLRLMTVDPERYLFDSTEITGGQLELRTHRLYGRERAVSTLTDVFDRVVGSNQPSEMVLISGHSGTGKSVLVEQLLRPLCEKKGHLVSMKFDELGQVQPVSAMMSAFNDFCGELLRGDERSLAQVRSSIEDALGPHGNVLMDSIPELRSVLGGGEPTSVGGAGRAAGKKCLNQFYFYFCLFVRAIAKPSHPVVIFLDDLQWADRTLLQLLSRLVSDRDSRSLLFIGSYRNNEVGPEHPLTEELGNMMVAGVDLMTIKLDNITRESVNALVSDTLRLSPRVTESLADVVHTKTSGNPLFVVQFLRSLRDEKLLWYSARSRRWEWDVEAIGAKDIADNVVDLMKRKMKKLDVDVQVLLKVAACLGSRSEVSTLKLLSSNGDDDGSGIMPFLDLAVSEGLMSRVGSRYKFSHDQIQQAAYNLIQRVERDSWHLRIGRLLRKKATEKELDELIFIIVDQLHRGSDLISDHSEKVEVARLCLVAGEKAASSSSFLQASICLLQGSMLLDEGDWEAHYDLSLRLFSRCAEAQYVTGNYDGVSITANSIFARSRCIEDKLRAYSTLLYSLGAQGKFCDAIMQGLNVLAQLGESFSSEPNEVDAVKELSKTRAMLEGTTVDHILQMNMLADANKLAGMKILSILLRYTYQVNQQLMSLMICRMVQMTLLGGTCRESLHAFASYGVVLCTLGEVELGYLYGKLALSLLERFKAKEYLAHVYVTVYGLTATFIKPLQAIPPLLKDGHQIGMAMGDNEWALTAAGTYLNLSFQCGSKLETLEKEFRAYMQQMKIYNLQLLMMRQPYFQTILNLMGCSASGDPTVLTGEAMDQDELLNRAYEMGLQNVANTVFCLRMWLAYLFKQYGVAADMAKRHREMNKARPVRLETLVIETFFTGLIAAVMASEGEEGDWRSIAFDASEKMATWAENSSWNFEHKLRLLEAEIAYHLNKDADAAAKAYDDAILFAGEHGFVHEQALACERAGIFYSETVNVEVGIKYFDRSHQLYLQWGAKSKAEDILELTNRD